MDLIPEDSYCALLSTGVFGSRWIEEQECRHPPSQ